MSTHPPTVPTDLLLAQDDLSHVSRTHEVVDRSQRPAVACDLTAAHLWAMAVPSGFGLEVDAQACAVATQRGGSRHRAAGVRGRRLELPPEHVTLLRDALITTPARTWLDCAGLMGWRDCVAMGDALLRARLAEWTELDEMVTWGRGRRGVRSARKALPVLDPASESPGESWARAYLLEAGVPMPVCNVEVTIHGQHFRLDMAWVEWKVAVEYDGVEFHGAEQREHDEWRRAILRRAGWTIIVLRKEDLRGPVAPWTQASRCVAPYASPASAHLVVLRKLGDLVATRGGCGHSRTLWPLVLLMEPEEQGQSQPRFETRPRLIEPGLN